MTELPGNENPRGIERAARRGAVVELAVRAGLLAVLWLIISVASMLLARS